MEPAAPPLPVCRNLPFQFCAGSQISKRMSESADGLIEPVARQNSGSFVKSAPCPGNAGCGDRNAPAATVSTASVVFGNATDASSAHERGGCADTAAAAGFDAAFGDCFAWSHAASAAMADKPNTTDLHSMIRSPKNSSRSMSHRIHRDVDAEPQREIRLVAGITRAVAPLPAVHDVVVVRDQDHEPAVRVLDATPPRRAAQAATAAPADRVRVRNLDLRHFR